ncbi:MAG: ParB N-terminal domain-containing protein [Oscillibacter sp.]|nr:ParB N-terminal domain-containing protein [Oscillibacter sp.]
MRIQIDKIKINPGRREALPEYIEELARSIVEVGLLNPITVDHDFTLIAGLHRLEAVKNLGWTEIECTVSSLEGLRAELAEIDENFVRQDLSAINFGDLLLRRKEIFETLHPQSKNGGDRRSDGFRASKCRSENVKSFVQDTAKKLGVGKRTVERQIQTAKNLTPEAKEILRHVDVSRENALKISRLAPAQQKEVASLLAAGEIKSIDGYLLSGEVAQTGSLQQVEGNASIVEDSPVSAPQEQTAPASVPEQEPKSEDTPAPDKKSKASKADKLPRRKKHNHPPKIEETPGTEEIKDAAIKQGATSSDPPYSLGGVKYTTIRESVADLKNPDKDCSNTPDSFLAEITEFVRKFLQEIGWFNMEDYEPVFPALTQIQAEYFQQQMEEILSAVKELSRHVQKGRSKHE